MNLFLLWMYTRNDDNWVVSSWVAAPDWDPDGSVEAAIYMFHHYIIPTTFLIETIVHPVAWKTTFQPAPILVSKIATDEKEKENATSWLLLARFTVISYSQAFDCNLIKRTRLPLYNHKQQCDRRFIRTCHSRALLIILNTFQILISCGDSPQTRPRSANPKNVDLPHARFSISSLPCLLSRP